METWMHRILAYILSEWKKWRDSKKEMENEIWTWMHHILAYMTRKCLVLSCGISPWAESGISGAWPMVIYLATSRPAPPVHFSILMHYIMSQTFFKTSIFWVVNQMRTLWCIFPLDLSGVTWGTSVSLLEQVDLSCNLTNQVWSVVQISKRLSVLISIVRGDRLSERTRSCSICLQANTTCRASSQRIRPRIISS